ncbi:hypothetical protein B0T24DRAFT_645274 [Lasiosphaeria ovina]|uniref:Rhodopsin domain-containing protein n=1 Tax=Lasiosphaeria ovina TaxID=92902 RepID=A0AAE0NJB4_9PEZI|nr:hypothetical protein B0T24DRAFT_645274 [Lasiosphaeria ovina]
MDQFPYLPKATQDALLAGPALAPPPGVTPNFKNPPNNNALAHGVMAACLAVSTLCLLLRIWLAILSRRVKGCYLGWTFCCYRLVDVVGYFVHQWDVILRSLIDLSYYVSIGGVLYSVTLPLLKVAILLEWTQMFVPRGTRNAFWWTCWALIGVQVLFGIAAVVALNLVCVPYRAIYDFTVPGKCYNKHTVDLASASVHLLTDVIMLVLPQRVIWGLQLSLRKKLGVSVVFSLGLLALVSAICRLQVTVTYATAQDVTYTLGPVVFWAFAEMTCGFVVSCMPAAPRLLKETRVLHRIKKALGMQTTTLDGTTGATAGMSRSKGTALNMSKPATAADKYHMIDEDGVSLENLGGGAKSESTEHLQEVSAAKLSGHSILRTTHVTVKGEYIHDEGKEMLPDFWSVWYKAQIDRPASGRLVS